MKIFLLGLTGAGKSTVGKILAGKLSYPYIDLDDVIKYETRKNIEDIFETEGEEGFRKIENTFLKKVSSQEDALIATGGGTPCYYDGIKFIKDNGLSVFLYTPVQVVTDRLYNTDTTQRPLIKNRSKDDLKTFLTEKLIERLPVYSQADFSIDTNAFNSPEDTAEVIYQMIALLNNYKKKVNSTGTQQ